MRKHRWSCETVERIFNKICEAEMRQRLAEVFDILLNGRSQLQKTSAFSKDFNFFERDSRLKHKRKESA